MSFTSAKPIPRPAANAGPRTTSAWPSAKWTDEGLAVPAASPIRRALENKECEKVAEWKARRSMKLRACGNAIARSLNAGLPGRAITSARAITGCAWKIVLRGDAAWSLKEESP
jgi:hypothetical protein